MQSEESGSPSYIIYRQVSGFKDLLSAIKVNEFFPNTSGKVKSNSKVKKESRNSVRHSLDFFVT
ncbi:hypothetical protein CH373_00500 [Leptospira perolatii]|uniref:Uncharacterized protein n=1 Tax=Leptospira perolatii TaxID=2023191 RepID=A0A2M9ZR74_9LEPT|nr:hypothetical protein CH360_00500 [Leptospira perolatii]PJZ74576.1 hypothetical protein CH373_00500 [Leptospira perolatii]